MNDSTMLGLIQREVAQEPYYRNNFDNDGQRFVAWYLRRVLLRDDAQTRDDITDGANDKEIDAVIVDDAEERIVIIQGKFITAGSADGLSMAATCVENAMQNALIQAQTAGKVFSPQNWLKSNASWQGETLVAGTQAGMLAGFPTGPALIERMKAAPSAFSAQWSAG
jgi:hypothetical protein